MGLFSEHCIIATEKHQDKRNQLFPLVSSCFSRTGLDTKMMGCCYYYKQSLSCLYVSLSLSFFCLYLKPRQRPSLEQMLAHDLKLSEL